MREAWKTAAVLLALTGCGPSVRPAPSSKDIVFLTRAGCVNTDRMRANLDAALKAEQQPTEYQFIDLDALPKDDLRNGYPTPTVLYAGTDLFGMAKPTPPFPEPT